MTRPILLPAIVPVVHAGEDNVEVYHSAFTPLEWHLNTARPQNACYVKVNMRAWSHVNATQKPCEINRDVAAVGFDLHSE